MTLSKRPRVPVGTIICCARLYVRSCLSSPDVGGLVAEHPPSGLAVGQGGRAFGIPVQHPRDKQAAKKFGSATRVMLVG
jgi:hypothetical protein